MKSISKFILILIFLCNNSFSKENLPVPRFVSLKSNEVNVRTGPSVRYPMKWIYRSKNEPLEIIAEFEQWRKIRDFDGEDGWVHESMLSGVRFIIINKYSKNVNIHTKPDISSDILYNVHPKVRMKLLSCKIDWCNVSLENNKGWISKNYLWGVYKNELYK